MDQVTIDSPLVARLAGLDHAVELVDASGRSLGQFIPTTFPPASDECPYSAAELAAARRQEGGRSLAEIWRSLGAK
jgi:hypothetical protein